MGDFSTKKFFLKTVFTLFVFLFFTSQVYAATIYSNSSTGNDSTGDGTSGLPYRTFHKAYTVASAGDTINLTGTFTWTDASETGDASPAGYTIGKNLTIVGQGADETIVQSATASTTGDRRVFTVSAGIVANFDKLNIRHGRVTGSVYGGGIYNSGTTTVTNSDINNNSSPSYGGGGVANYGIFTIEDSSIRNNTGYYGGGGIRNMDLLADLFITNTTITGNQQMSSTGYTDGGGIDARYGDVTLTNSAIVYNSAYGTGGLCMCDTTGTLTIKNTIIANNLKKGGGSAYDFYKNNVGSTVTDNGKNIVGSSNGSYTWVGSGDWTDTDLNGSFTLYSVGTTGSLNMESTSSTNDDPDGTYNHAIFASSIAIDNGATGANGATSTVPTLDQRGATRNSTTDIGPFEYNGGGLSISAPTTQASSVTFSSVEYNRMTVSWTNGNGSRRVAFMKAASSGTASPVDGTSYASSSVFGSGDQIGSSGWYAIYDGLGSSVTVTGLTQGVTYIVQVFEYNGVSSGTADYLTDTATNNPNTQQSHAVVTLYVNSSTGNDSTGDGSSGSPYLTFHKGYTSASAGDTINLTGTFTWTDSGETGDSATTGYTLSKDLTIQGNGADDTILQSATASTTGDRRIFTVSSGATVTIDDIMLRNGRVTGSVYGGAIDNSGTLTITDSDINNNSSPSYGGGGIVNYSTLTLDRVSMWNNTGYYGGGAIRNLDANGDIFITNSTLAYNQQMSSGVYTNGGAIDMRYGDLTLTNSVIAYNSAYGVGGLCMCDTTGTLTIKNSIIASNLKKGGGSAYDFYKSNAGSTVTDNGKNIVGSSNSSYTWVGSGDWTDTDLNGTFTLYSVGTTGSLNQSSTLATNSALNNTYTLAITSASSIAKDNGATGTNGTISVPTTDQRQGTRNGTTDIGAYEYGATFGDTTVPTVSVTAPSSDATVSGASVSFTADASDDVAVAGVKFYVNGVLQGSEDTTSTYGITWDSTATTSGAYTLVAVARDSSNNYATSTSVSFNVLNTGPTPTSVVATGSDNGATITWTTADAASSRVYFGPTTSYGSSTPETDTSPRVTSHSVSVSGLPSCAYYHYYVESKNTALDTATSSDYTFSTTGCTSSASITASGNGTIATASGGTLTQGDITLTVPTSFTNASSSAIFQANQLNSTTFFSGITNPSGLNAVGDSVFHLSAFIDATTTISSFSAPISVRLAYTSADVEDIDETTLWIYRYDGSSWYALNDCSVDTSGMTVTCTTTNFSDFALFGEGVDSSGGSNSGFSANSQVVNLINMGKVHDAVLIIQKYPSILNDKNVLDFLKKYLDSIALTQNVDLSGPNILIEKDLYLGSEGEDVKKLQTFLIAQNKGPISKELARVGVTGYFGQYTKNALGEFQKSVGIVPYSGYFGPKTRAFVSDLKNTKE
ncbi:MAG: Ig-like domain-containing protein [Candidatus Paceibacterota bacterium]